MVPVQILGQLSRVRSRQRAFRVAWGAARTLALAFAAMAVACLTDWLIDLRTDTPGGLRGMMIFLQAALWVGAAGWLVVRPLLRVADDREIALWVEEKFPEFGHRLITAVELNVEGARTGGMSGELIGAVTRQAEEQTAKTVFTSRVDGRPFTRALSLAAGVAAVAALVYLAAPDTVRVLVARQFMSDVAIPRSVTLASETTRVVRPTGEETMLRFFATGRVEFDRLSGIVEVQPVGLPPQEYVLALESIRPTGEAVYGVKVPPAGADFHYRAWLGDGRTRRPAEVVYEPRPVVQKIDAWMVLPEYCGKRPDGSPYEQYRQRGEIAGPQGSWARLAISVQKPVVKATLELMGRPGGETARESVVRSIEMELGGGAQEARAKFELIPGELAYRIRVEDRNGFENTAPPRRGIALLADEPPRVVLLPERFSLPGETEPAADTEVEGIPVPLGGALRVAYYTAHPYGLDRAQFLWRVIKPGGGSDDPQAGPAPWQILPLHEVYQTEKSGPFDVRTGCFENTGEFDQVEFHPMASVDPERVHGRTEGGGRFDLQTKPLQGIQPGDQVEFCVEVFARNPALAKTPGRSDSRIKTFVTTSQLLEWMTETLQHEGRIRQLESRQRAVFTPEGVNR